MTVKFNFLLFIFFFQTIAIAQSFEFKKLTTREGLSHSSVYGITEDERGFMWFATREGLNSFDSYKIRSYYSPTNGLTDNTINCILSTETGLYIGTQKGLDRYIPEKDKFESLKKGDPITGQILNLYESMSHVVYISTTNGLYKLDKNDNITLVLKDILIRNVCNYKKNVLWVALNNRILLINDSGDIIKEYDLSSSLPNIGNTHFQPINKLFKDSDGVVWVGSSSGLFYFDVEQDKFKIVPINNITGIEGSIVRDIAEDQSKNLWLGTENGVIVYNKNTHTSFKINQSFNNDKNQLSDKAVYSIYISDENIVWIGTYFGGVNYAKLEQTGFLHLAAKANGNYLRGKAVSQIIEDDQNVLWVSTEDGGITKIDKRTKHFSFINIANSKLSSNNIHSIHQDNKGYTWIGTFLGGLNRLDTEKGTIKVYKNDFTDETSISNNYVYAIKQDKRDTLWVGTQYGLNIYNYEKDSFEVFRPEIFKNKFIYDILEDKAGNIWICTRHSGIYKYVTATNKIIHFSSSNKKENGLNSNQIISASEDSKGNIWFGSLNGGLIKWEAENKKFKSYTIEDGLPNNNVYGAIEDNDGYIWITSNKGLSKLDTVSEKIMNFSVSNGLPTNQFNFKSLYKDSEGQLYFGTINGLVYFYPNVISQNVEKANIHFTGFKLFNEDVKINDKKSILRNHIDFTDSVELKYEQNVITIEFSGINFKTNGNNEYAYYLEGFQNDWNNVGNTTSATYTNLSPGNYTFHAKMLNFNGDGGSRQLHLTILPPFWLSNWAFLLYALLLFSSIFAYSRFIKFIHNQKLAVTIEKVEKEKIKEVNRHKLNFFTFISHELKTPLTLILVSIENYFQQRLSSNPPEELISVKQNARKLHHLILQLMEFRKMETDHAKLELRKGDVILFLKDTFNAFVPLFEHKHIEHHFKHNFSEYTCYFDPEKLEMIFTNIISNAIKYTTNNGKINVVAKIADKLDAKHRALLTITVTDTGKGMTDEEISKVFTPFYTTETQDIQTDGSGLGLALVKSLVTFLEGSIEIKNENGSTVIVQIPLTLKNKSNEKIETINGNRFIEVKPDLLLNDMPYSHSDQLQDMPQEMSILIVEDNKELILFLSKYFSKNFKIIRAKDGVEALQKLERYHPDLIISDVKMPNMNGIVLCKKVKSNKATAHIPFILLTARTEETQKIEGLSVGANAYVAKPFNLKELDLLIKNLLESNKHLKSRFSNISFSEQQNLPSNNREIEFIKKITTLVDSHYQDPNFNIQDLAEKVSISRSLLHIKMKKTMHTNASDFIKKVRMAKAVELMKQGMLISEVAYKVGYNDPNYFSRVFKKEFDISPSSYMESEE
tara:strand:+ start:15715 stop:19731 length:4017 start_codon:yes stop_codon:yes gene_type:complete